MTNNTEIENENEKVWSGYHVSENEMDILKQQAIENPIISHKFDVMRIKYNIRCLSSDESVDTNPPVVTPCGYGSPEDEELMFRGITLPECCLMAYDIENICPLTNKKIKYDLAIVRTEKPKEYWAKHYK